MSVSCSSLGQDQGGLFSGEVKSPSACDHWGKYCREGQISNNHQGGKDDVRGFYGLVCLPAVFFHIIELLLNRKAMLTAANAIPMTSMMITTATIGGVYCDALVWAMVNHNSQRVRINCAIEAAAKAVWPLPLKNLTPAAIKVNAMQSVMNDSP